MFKTVLLCQNLVFITFMRELARKTERKDVPDQQDVDHVVTLHWPVFISNRSNQHEQENVDGHESLKLIDVWNVPKDLLSEPDWLSDKFWIILYYKVADVLQMLQGIATLDDADRWIHHRVSVFVFVPVEATSDMVFV